MSSHYRDVFDQILTPQYVRTVLGIDDENPAVVSPTWDAVTITFSKQLLSMLVKQGYPVELAADMVAQNIADTLAIHRAERAS